jgi:hypothetical protein
VVAAGDAGVGDVVAVSEDLQADLVQVTLEVVADDPRQIAPDTA